MTFAEYRDMYYAISNGIEIGVSAESIIDEVVHQRRIRTISSKEYDKLLSFFKQCDEKNNTDIVLRSKSVIDQQFREENSSLY